MKRAMIAIPLVLLWASFLTAAERYGDAVVEEGAMTIIRDGETLSFKSTGDEIPVFEQDLLRLRSNSRAVLRGRENAVLTLGSNAIFQVKPWEVKEESGFLRALFGKFRSVVTDLIGGDQFNIKTPTATIGVKGTEYFGAVTSDGDTMLIVTESRVQLLGQRGEPVIVGEGFVSVVTGRKSATPPAPVPTGVRNNLSEDNLDSAPPTSDEAEELPGEVALVDAGIIDGEGGEGSEIDIDSEDSEFDTPDIDIDLDEAQNNLFRGEADIQF